MQIGDNSALVPYELSTDKTVIIIITFGWAFVILITSFATYYSMIRVRVL